MNSINFGNFLGELYWFIQERKISQDVLYRIQNEYLSEIKSENLTEEYQIVTDSIKKIRFMVDKEDAEGF